MILRQALAVIVCSFVTSLSTLLMFLAWGGFQVEGINWLSLPRDFVVTLIFITPIAAAGITFLGLPLLFILRRYGWIQTIRRFKVFGVIAGMIWAVVASLVIEIRAEVIWLMAVIGGVNGLLTALLWLNIVEKFRASQRHKIPNGEIT
jgi:hypothetical protein